MACEKHPKCIEYPMIKDYIAISDEYNIKYTPEQSAIMNAYYKETIHLAATLIPEGKHWTQEYSNAMIAAIKKLQAAMAALETKT